MRIIPGREFIAQGCTIRTGDIPISILTIMCVTSNLILSISPDPTCLFFILIGLTFFLLWIAIKFEQFIGIR